MVKKPSFPKIAIWTGVQISLEDRGRCSGGQVIAEGLEGDPDASEADDSFEDALVGAEASEGTGAANAGEQHRAAVLAKMAQGAESPIAPDIKSRAQSVASTSHSLKWQGI